MPVTANILVLSDEPAQKIHDCFKDENVALTKSAILDFEELKNDISDFDLILISSSATDLIHKNDLLDGILAADVPLLIIGPNHRNIDIQSVPFSFCELELKTRVNSLIRLQTMKQEYKRRKETTSLYGFMDHNFEDPSAEEHQKSILLVGNQNTIVGDVMLQLSRSAKVRLCPNPELVIDELRAGQFEAAIILGAGQGDTHFRLCLDIRGDSRLYNLPIIFVLENEGNREAAFIHGASDIAIHPTEMGSLFARSKLLIDQSEYRFSLQKLLKTSKPLPVTDGLTGLYSHGFIHAHMNRVISDHEQRGKYLTIASVEIDNLNDINQEFGYPAGDQVLRQVGNIISLLMRGEDFCGRFNSNSFLMALPGTPKKDAYIALSRVYGVSRNTEFSVAAVPKPVQATIKMGLTEMASKEELEAVLKRAASEGFTQD